MCGILGLVYKDQSPVNKDHLKFLADKIAHRGPDDEGYFIDRNLGFYHKRLSIIDIEQGKQPMSMDDLTIVFNGEIYNYVELRNSLQQKGYHFRTNSDTEVILKMYLEYGEKCVDFLNGMFAFIIYDSKKSRLFIARDHFGIKPLYYFNGKDCLLFASEIKAILADDHVESEADYHSIHEYLTFQFVLEDKTLFKHIYKILPGHYGFVNLTDYSFNQYRYWEPNFELDLNHTQNYFISELRSILEDTIKLQLRSDVPLGTYLSGGMDSSVVSILSAKYNNEQLSTFTGAFREGKDFDETGYAKEIGDTINAKQFQIYPTVSDFVEHMPKLIYHLDEPVAGPGIFPQYMVSKLAKENVTVVLGGQGGDEIFGGYSRYAIAYFEQALKGAIFETNEEGEHIVSLKSIIPNLPYLHKYVPMMSSFWQKGAFTEADRRYFDLIERSSGSLSYFSDAFKETYSREQIFGCFKEVFNRPNTKSYFNKMTQYDMFASLPALLQVEDRVSMAVGLESRVPLLDRRIVDLISSMPPSMKFKGAELKYIFKKAVGDLLPKKILNRKDKMGFPVPLHLWAKNGAQEFIRSVLMDNSCYNRGLFNPKEIEKLISSEQPFGRELWGLLSLELWFKTFID